MGKNLWKIENQIVDKGFGRIAGIDEAGRGPLAGPVVSAAVILPLDFSVSHVDDSKKLTPKIRDLLYDEIYANADTIGIGIVDPVEIDRINILNAALLSMVMAGLNLNPRADFHLIDGPFNIPLSCHQSPIVKGDSKSISIAAASVVAKVTRDRIMKRYHEDYPEYGFSKHKGYPTKAHKLAIQTYGCCPIHRRSFKGVREFL